MVTTASRSNSAVRQSRFAKTITPSWRPRPRRPLQAAANKLTAATIEKRLNYWSWLLGPKFSEKDRKAVNLDRKYSINQIEYCRNFIFKRNFPIHNIFERSCEIGLFRLTADKVAQIFGVRVTKRSRGKLYS